MTGVRNRNKEKYRKEATCPMMIKGCSTGMPPIHVRITTSATRSQNRAWARGRKVRLRCLEVWRKGTAINTKMEAKRARTPPSLLGIERRIA